MALPGVVGVTKSLNDMSRCCRWRWRRRTSSSTSPTPCPTQTSHSAWPPATTCRGQTTCLCASSTPSSRPASTTRRPRSLPAPPRYGQVVLYTSCLFGPSGHIGRVVSSISSEPIQVICTKAILISLCKTTVCNPTWKKCSNLF